MKKLISFLAISCLGASCALANIGETYQQSCKRYGKPSGTCTLEFAHEKAVAWFNFSDGNESITATFTGPDGRCDYIAYTYWNPKQMSETQIWTYLSSNIDRNDGFSEYQSESGRNFASRTCLALLYITESMNIPGARGTCLQIQTRSHNVEAWAKHRAAEGSEVGNEPDPNQLPDVGTSKTSI